MPSQPEFSTRQILLTIFFHQSQQMKNSGNRKILPQIIVCQKQHILLVLIIVPVILILSDRYLASSSALISLALRLSEQELPLKVQISALVPETDGPQFRKEVCIQAIRPVQYGSAFCYNIGWTTMIYNLYPILYWGLANQNSDIANHFCQSFFEIAQIKQQMEIWQCGQFFQLLWPKSDR